MDTAVPRQFLLVIKQVGNIDIEMTVYSGVPVTTEYPDTVPVSRRSLIDFDNLRSVTRHSLAKGRFIQPDQIERISFFVGANNQEIVDAGLVALIDFGLERDQMDAYMQVINKHVLAAMPAKAA